MQDRANRRWFSLNRSVILVLLFLLLSPLKTRATTPGEDIPPVRHSSAALTLTANGATLLVVNPDSNSLTLVDTTSHQVLAELPVGVDPRTVTVDDTAGRAYVANRGSDTISVVDLAARAVITDVAVGYRPYGVVVDPEGKRLYVAEQGSDTVQIFNTIDLSSAARISVSDRPSGLLLTPDGHTLYVTHLLSNQITVVHVREHILYLPIVLRTTVMSWRVRAIDSSEAVSTFNSQLSTFNLALFSDSNLVQSLVLSPDGTRAYVPHTVSNSGKTELTFDTTVFPKVAVIDLVTQQHLTDQQIALEVLDPPGVGLPFDTAMTPDGRELWVVNAASNDLSVVDLDTRRLVAHIEVGHNPRAIVISPDGTTAYVNNTLAGTVSVLDTAVYTVTEVITTTQIPLPPALLNGKRLFHSSDDPRMSRAQWISCNTCHFEGEHDGRTWFFGFAGPRNTTSLLGMIETYPLRWSGEWDESADSEYANRQENFGSGLIEGAMNCAIFPPDCVHQPPNQGRSYDLDSLALFLDSLAVVPSPGHTHGKPLGAAETRGAAIFEDPALGCIICHPPPLYTDLQMHDVGTATPDERIGPAYDTPTLRGLYDSAPYFHDGSAATLYETLTRQSPGDEHDVRDQLTEDEIADLIAFLKALPFEE